MAKRGFGRHITGFWVDDILRVRQAITNLIVYIGKDWPVMRHMNRQGYDYF